MKKIEKQLKKDSHNVYLLQTEQNAIKTSIIGDLHSEQGRSMSIFSFSNMIYRLAPTALVTLLLVGLPVTYASQNSVPGDLLYSFEINIVEEIEALFYLSDDTKIEYHTARLEERLQELKQVVHEPDADITTAPVTQEIRDHSNVIINITDNDIGNEQEINQLVVVSAVVEASSDILHIAQNDNSEHSNIKDSTVIIENMLAAEIEEFTDQNDVEEASNLIAENIEEINLLTEENTDSILETYVHDQLNRSDQALVEEDLNEALTILNKTRSEILRQEYLDNTK